MAAKKDAKPKAAAPAADDAAGARLPDFDEHGLDAVTAKIIEMTIGHPERGVVCLVGPPGTGKTRYHRRFAETRKRQAVIWNIQCNEPEEQAGFPDKFLLDGKIPALRYTIPPGFPEEVARKIYILNERGADLMLVCDEMDKPEKVKTDTLLALFDDQRRIRDKVMPPDMALVAAMNQPDVNLFNEALLDRLILIPWPRTPAGWKEGFKTETGKMFADMFLQGRKPPVIPQRPPEASKRAGHYLEAWGLSTEFWEYEDLRETLVYGLLNTKDAASFLSKLREEVVIPGKAWAQRVHPSQFRAQWTCVTNALNHDQRIEVFRELQERLKADPTGELGTAMREVFDDHEEVAKIGPRTPAEAATAPA